MFRVGDKVRIKETACTIDDFWVGLGGDHDNRMYFRSQMSPYLGRTAVIIRKIVAGPKPRSERFKDCDMWVIDSDGGNWVWVDEWFELVKENIDIKKDRFDSIVEEEI